MRRTSVVRSSWAITLALAVAALVAGCTAEPSLRVPGADGGGVQLGIPRVTPGEVLVVRGVMACLDEAGEVDIDSVTAIDPHHVAVVDFALRDNPSWDEGETNGRFTSDTDTRGDLTAAGFDRAAKTATHTCDPGTGRGHEIGIELRATPGGEVGSVRGFEVHYGGDRTVPIRFAVVLCPDESAGSPRCAIDLLE